MVRGGKYYLWESENNEKSAALDTESHDKYTPTLILPAKIDNTHSTDSVHCTFLNSFCLCAILLSAISSYPVIYITSLATPVRNLKDVKSCILVGAKPHKPHTFIFVNELV